LNYGYNLSMNDTQIKFLADIIYKVGFTVLIATSVKTFYSPVVINYQYAITGVISFIISVFISIIILRGVKDG